MAVYTSKIYLKWLYEIQLQYVMVYRHHVIVWVTRFTMIHAVYVYLVHMILNLGVTWVSLILYIYYNILPQSGTQN